MHPQPSIDISGITVLEPTTTLTNLMIAAMSFWAYARPRKTGDRSPHTSLIKGFFLFMGYATVMGGLLGHGFLYILGFKGKIPGWLFSMISVAFLERTAIVYTREQIQSDWVRWINYANILELIVFFGIVLFTLEFKYVEMHALYGLGLVVMPLNIWVVAKNKSIVSQWMLWGVLIGIITGVVHTLKLSLHVFFNHADIAHVLMIGSIYCFYRAGEAYIARLSTAQG